MDLRFSTDWPAGEVVALQRSTFAASEGSEEGEVIGELTANLLATTPAEHVVSCSAAADDTPMANIVFSRLFFPDDPRCVFILGPVAVAPAHQRQGIGQALIGWGLTEIAQRGADVAVTYGDPAYYPKVGFEAVGTDTVPAPYKLKWAGGWMAQSLTTAPLTPFKGPSRPVPAFARPEYW
ncbi:MAG: N-acetyltransferase [Paracoccaceae bacterium]|nr:N-acetyltransferase [Paracoccaceae bacterium]